MCQSIVTVRCLILKVERNSGSRESTLAVHLALYRHTACSIQIRYKITTFPRQNYINAFVKQGKRSGRETKDRKGESLSHRAETIVSVRFIQTEYCHRFQEWGDRMFPLSFVEPCGFCVVPECSDCPIRINCCHLINRTPTGNWDGSTRVGTVIYCLSKCRPLRVICAYKYVLLYSNRGMFVIFRCA